MGYVVLYTNPRQHQLWRGIFQPYPSRLSGDDFYDMNSGVDAVIAKATLTPTISSSPVAAAAGSSPADHRAHRPVPRCAPLYPVINWYSFALTSDIPFITKYWFPALPWENTENYMQRSLTNLVGKVRLLLWS